MVVESPQPTPTTSSGARGGSGAPAASAATVGAPTTGILFCNAGGTVAQ